MQLMIRDRDLPELIDNLRGKKVLIWTCNTCARMCAVGGSMNAQRLSTALRSAGIDVVGQMSSKAVCVMSSVEDARKTSDVDFDIILALTCDAGARTVSAVYGRECLNPVLTLGVGYLRSDGRPILMKSDGSETTLDGEAERLGLRAGAFLL